MEGADVEHDGEGRRFIVHEVARTDTLAGLAIRYGVEVMDIKRANRLLNDLQMFAQKSLRIPLPGPHPPSAALSSPPLSRDPSRSSSSPFHSPPRTASWGHRRSDLHHEAGGLQKRITPAIGLLRGYYGLKSPPSEPPEGEGTELRELPVYGSRSHSRRASGNEVPQQASPTSAAESPTFERWASFDDDRSPVPSPLGSATATSVRAFKQAGSRKGKAEVVEDADDRRLPPVGAAHSAGGGWAFTLDPREPGMPNPVLGNGASVTQSNEGDGSRQGKASLQRDVVSRGERKAGRSSQAMEVAAVVEQLARAHRDRHVPEGLAGEVGGGWTEEERAVERLTRRRSRAGEGGATLANEGLPGGTDWKPFEGGAAGMEAGARVARGSIPGRGPVPNASKAGGPAAQTLRADPALRAVLPPPPPPRNPTFLNGVYTSSGVAGSASDEDAPRSGSSFRSSASTEEGSGRGLPANGYGEPEDPSMKRSSSSPTFQSSGSQKGPRSASSADLARNSGRWQPEGSTGSEGALAVQRGRALRRVAKQAKD